MGTGDDETMQKVDALMIGNELNGAGVKDKTLPASKLKTDTDADKIQLENLSAEVLENMSGQAAVTANTAAATADQATADALDAAALAESKAALAEEKAAYAVTKADLAQTAKDHADQKAALAQTQADYAKTQGDYGKAQGDYAKAQGDLAKGVVAGVIPNATQAASGLMSPADNTMLNKSLPSMVMGNKLTLQSLANFADKIAGSTTANPHSVRAYSHTTLLAPNSGLWRDEAQDDYTRISTLNGTTFTTTTSTIDRYGEQLFSFNLIEHVQRAYGIIPGSSTLEKITWLQKNLSSLTFDWYGLGSGPTSNKTYLRRWRTSDSTWVGTTDRTSTVVGRASIAPTITDGSIDTNGFVHFLAYADPSNGTTASSISTDYAELQITLSIDVTSNLIPATQSAGGAMSPSDKVVLDKSIPSVFMGNKITLQSAANFVGKVTGSTVANPNYATRASAPTLQTPTQLTTETEQYRYDGAAALGGTVWTQSASTNMIQKMFAFNLIEHVQRTYGTIPGATTAEKIAWLGSNVTRLTGYWHGFGSSPSGNKATLTVWSPPTNGWLSSGTGFSTHSGNAITRLTSISTNASVRIDNNGFVYFLVYAESGDGTVSSVLTTDYIELIVELSIDIKTNLLLGGMQGYKLTKDDGLVIRLADNTDLNTVLDTGLYYIVTPPNAPEPNNGWYVDVKKLTSVYVTQKATMNNATRQTEYVRHFFNGAWTPWSRSTDAKQTISSFMGASVVDQSIANYVGKVSGSTTANPHIAKMWAHTSLLAPSQVLWNESYTNYSRLGSIDGTYANISNLTNGNIAQSLFSFDVIAHVERTYGTIPGADTASKVTWLKSNIKTLISNWFGFGSSPTGNKATVAIWTQNSNSWFTAGGAVVTSSTVGKAVRSLNASADITSDGFIHLCAFADPSDGVTHSIINTDYIELIVELSTTAKANLLAQGFQGHKLTTDTGTAITPPNGTDFNTLTDTGYYVYSNDNAHKGSPNGYPYWLVEVTKYSATLSVQTWKGIVHDETFVRRTVTGGWSPFRKNVDQNILGNVVMGNKSTFASTANFLGKVSGRTIENPHTARANGSNTTLQSPVNGSFSEFRDSTALPDYNYPGLMSLDGTTTRVRATPANVAAHMVFSFDLIEHVKRTYGTIPGATTAEKVSWLKANINFANNISAINFIHHGFGTSPSGSKLILAYWNPSTQVWQGATYHNASTTYALGRLLGTSGHLFIDDNGFVHFIAYTDPSDGTTASIVNTDYVELQVELSTDVKSNLLLNGVQGHKLTQDDGFGVLPANSTNFDNIKASGYYRYSPELGHIGAPEPGVAFNVEVMQYNANIVSQRWSSVSQDTIYVRRSSSSGWSSYRKQMNVANVISSLMGNSVTEQTVMNFIGKVSGSTTANPHVFKGSDASSGNTSTLPPSSNAFFEQTVGGYGGVVALGDSLATTSRTGTGVIAQQLFSFNVLAHIERLYGTIPANDTAGKVAWLKANITKLTATWHGFGTGPTGNKGSLTRWDANAGAWLSTAVTGTTHTGSGVLPLTFTPGVATSIDASGFMHLLAYAEPSDGTTASVINTDFVEVKVDLDTSLKKNLAPVWIDAVLQNGWVEYDSALKVQYSLGADGFVTIRGAVKSGTVGAVTPVFTLPVGFRPNRSVRLMVASGAAIDKSYRVSVIASGAVSLDQVTGTADNTYIHLEGVRFPIN